MSSYASYFQDVICSMRNLIIYMLYQGPGVLIYQVLTTFYSHIFSFNFKCIPTVSFPFDFVLCPRVF